MYSRRWKTQRLGRRRIRRLSPDFFRNARNTFGDYFKKSHQYLELITDVEFQRAPIRDRLQTGPGDPSISTRRPTIIGKLFSKKGLDPDVHIVNGNKKDNFWMMGDTALRSVELHVDLTPEGDTRGSLHEDSPWCIEI